MRAPITCANRHVHAIKAAWPTWTGSSANCTIQGNVIRGMNTGIWLAGGGTDNNVVVGNRIESPTVAAILNWGAGNLIANNL